MISALLGVLIASLVGYSLFLIARPDPSGTVKQYLSSRRLALLPFSLAAANLSVAGGLAALISATDYYGVWSIVAPLSTAIGFAVFATICSRPEIAEGGLDYPLVALDRLVSQAGTATFLRYHSLSTVFIYAFSLGWEIYVGAQLLGEVIYTTPSSGQVLLIAILLTASVCAYLYLGGFGAVVKTDMLQFGFCVLVLICLYVSHRAELLPFGDVSFHAAHNLSSADIVLFVVSVAILNIVIQIQNPINWQLAQSARRHTVRVFAVGGTILVAFWSATIYLALAHSGSSYPELFRLSTFWAKVLLILGISAFGISTIDGITIACINALQSARERDATAARPITVQSLRFQSFALLLIALVVAFGLIHRAPNIFHALIGLSGCLSVYAPVFLLVALKPGGAAHRLTSLRVRLLFGGFLTSTLVQFAVLISQRSQYVFHVVAATLAFGFLVTLMPLGRRRLGEHVDE